MAAAQIFVPLKKSWDVDLEGSLKAVLPKEFKKDEEVLKAIKELDKLRKEIVMKKNQKTAFYLEQLCRYHDQIGYLANRFPEELKTPFAWEDAFGKAYVFSGKPNLGLAFLGYEKHCVLFNIAAQQSQLAVDCSNVDTDEERKSATKYYQNASGIFESLKPADAAGNNLTPDFHPDLLSSLSELMLVQAQEMYITKAINDKMKDAIIAKLCVQARDMFANLLLVMTRETVKYIWDKAWLSNVKGKAFAYNGLANYFQSRVCGEKKIIGEEIARLHISIDEMKKGQDKMGDTTFLSFFMTEAKRLLAGAEKDNNFIYHEPIPAAGSLATIPNVATAKLAKMTQAPEKMAPDVINPFETLMKPPEPVAPPRKKKDDGGSDSPADEPDAKKAANATNGARKAPSWSQVLNDSWTLVKPYFEEVLTGKK